MPANEKQVGGTHYQGKTMQHWDLVSMYDWDYFQAQITKYLMRWKTKHTTPEGRLQDLKKAQHFLEKYIELQEKKTEEVVEKVPKSGWWGKPGEYFCFKCGSKVIASSVDEAERTHGMCAPGSGYVQQDTPSIR